MVEERFYNIVVYPGEERERIDRVKYTSLLVYLEVLLQNGVYEFTVIDPALHPKREMMGA